MENYILCPNVQARFSKNRFIYIRIGLFKRIIMEGREFRGSLDEKMRRLWLGRESFLASLPPLYQPSTIKNTNNVSKTKCVRNP